MSLARHAPHALPEHCPNCDAAVHGPYCAQCGQETVHELPTLHEFVHEYLHHYVAAEGKLVATVKLLILKPGQLTVEYLAGRRKRYVKPLPLYLTFSFLFFLLLGWSGMFTPLQVVHIDGKPVAHPAQALATIAASDADPDERRLLSFTAQVVGQLNQAESFAAFSEHLLHRLPYALFVLMPLFAAMCALVYRSRQQSYGVHLLFALHLHAFAFIAFLVCLLPGVRSYAACAVAVLFVWLVVALRRVYGGRWWPQLSRAFFLAGAYALMCALALGLVTLMSSGITLQAH
jgi:hypothetical protein